MQQHWKVLIFVWKWRNRSERKKSISVKIRHFAIALWIIPHMKNGFGGEWMIHRNTQNKLGKGRVFTYRPLSRCSCIQSWLYNLLQLILSYPLLLFFFFFCIAICSDCTALHNRTRTTIHSTSNNNNNDGNGNCIDEKRKSISDFVCAIAYCDRWSSLIYSLFLI